MIHLRKIIVNDRMIKRGFIIACDSCDAKTHEINTDNEVVAQRVAVDFLHWKVYRGDKDWKRACPSCVRKFKREGKFK